MNDTDCGIKSSLSKFVDDTKVSSAVDTTEGRDVIKRDLGKFEKWAHKNLTRFDKAKCKVLHLGQSNPTHMYGLGEETERNPVQEDLWVLWADEKLEKRQRMLRVRKAKCTLGCIKSSRQQWGDCLPVLCTCEAPSRALYPGLRPSA